MSNSCEDFLQTWTRGRRAGALTPNGLLSPGSTIELPVASPGVLSSSPTSHQGSSTNANSNLPLTPKVVKVRVGSEKLTPNESTGTLQNLGKNRMLIITPSSGSKLVALPPASTPSLSLPPSLLRRDVKLANTIKAKVRYTRDLIKSLTNIAVSLEKGKNLRNLFVDLAEIAVRPLTKLGLTGAEVERFFEILQEQMPPKMLQREVASLSFL